MTKIDICAKIQACLKEHKLYQTDNVIMSVDPSFNNCSTLLINPSTSHS